QLDIAPPRYKPLFPLGRASEAEEPLICGGQLSQLNERQLLIRGIFPIKTCGIGKNLYVEPGGDAYPCVAWRTTRACVGNVITDGLELVLRSKQFAVFAERSVDTIERCKDCEFRYLCGGGCRAWNNDEDEVNASPVDCSHLKIKAEKLIAEARRVIDAG
ncbi:MAG: SPASM domain-containing protein, partial [Bacteroidales bacterium]|nr:SPASM domain-containing protein [Bacteroidales bacterium]